MRSSASSWLRSGNEYVRRRGHFEDKPIRHAARWWFCSVLASHEVAPSLWASQPQALPSSLRRPLWAEPPLTPLVCPSRTPRWTSAATRMQCCWRPLEGESHHPRGYEEVECQHTVWQTGDACNAAGERPLQCETAIYCGGGRFRVL